MNQRSLRPWAGAAIFFITTAAVAAGDLTLREALSLAADRNPDLRPVLLELPALAGRREQVGLRPNPELALELENVTGSGAYADAGRAEITLALSQLIELGGKRGLRVGVVDSTSEVAEGDLVVARIDLAAEVLRRFIHAAGSQERLALARRQTELQDRALSAVEARVAAARSPEAELHRARAAKNRASLEEQNAGRDLAIALHALAALWGDAEPAFSAVQADLYSLPTVGDLATLMEQVRESPHMQVLLSQSRLRESELQLARAQARQDLTVAGGIRRLEETDDFAVVLSLQMPLGVYNRNQGAIREAGVRREQADAQFDAALLRARADLFAFVQQLEQARTETETLRSAVVPELEQAVEQTERGYSLGRYSYLELADAQRSLIEAGGTLIDAAARYHATLAEIERITGQAFALAAY